MLWPPPLSRRGASSLLLSVSRYKYQNQALDRVLHRISKTSLHSMSSSRASLPNYYLRKRRRWPLPLYKPKWHADLACQQAMETFKENARHSKIHILQSLIDSFATHNCCPFPDAYHFILKRLFLNPRTWDQIPQVVYHMQEVAAFEIPEPILVDLINFYGNSNGTVQQAVDIFFQIPKFRCSPTVHSLNALLKILCEKRCCLHIIPQILIKSQLLNIRIEDSSIRILIRALCRFGKVKVAVQFFNYMFRNAFDFDGRIASMILRAMCEEKEFREADIMLFLVDSRSLGFNLDKADCYHVICFLVKIGSGKDAMEALTWTRQDGVEPDIVCYNLVLNKLVLDEDYACANQLFDQMLVLGLVPDIFTYNSYINSMCKQNKVKDGLKMLYCMEELGCKPNSKTFDIILKALLAHGKWDLAREISRKMESRGMQLDLEKCELMISGLSMKNSIPRSL